MPAPTRPPTLAQRHAELAALRLDGAKLRFVGNAELRFTFTIAPSEFGRFYECELRVPRNASSPEMRVLQPDLVALAEGRPLPHVYSSEPNAVKLCLWRPKQREWMSQMTLKDTYIPWTAEWLAYFELWLATGTWEGGGEHPTSPEKTAAAARTLAKKKFRKA